MLLLLNRSRSKVSARSMNCLSEINDSSFQNSLAGAGSLWMKPCELCMCCLIVCIHFWHSYESLALNLKSLELVLITIENIFLWASVSDRLILTGLFHLAIPSTSTDRSLRVPLGHPWNTKLVSCLLSQHDVATIRWKIQDFACQEVPLCQAVQAIPFEAQDGAVKLL